MSSRKEQTPERRVSHIMTLWPDIDVQVDKLARMGVNASVSRTDFNRLCDAKRALEKVNFLEIKFIRKTMVLEGDDTELYKLLSKLSNDDLRDRCKEMVARFERERLEKVYLVLLSYAGKEFFV